MSNAKLADPYISKIIKKTMDIIPWLIGHASQQYVSLKSTIFTGKEVKFCNFWQPMFISENWCTFNKKTWMRWNGLGAHRVRPNTNLFLKNKY